MSAISSLSSAATSAASTSAAGTPSLSQADFFKLLITQLQNQSPLDPVSSSDFVSQLSQFSTVQGIQQLNTNLSSFLATQGISQAASLIGKPVSYDPGNGNLVSGTVDSVALDASGKMQLMVGGKSVQLTQLRSISNPKTKTAA
jgi:flagellar basal-body rod modification protein FlgD